MQNYFLRVIPTLKHYSDIVCDIPSGSVYGIFILTFYLTFFLTFYPASILTHFPAYILTFFLTFYLASILTYFLTNILTFFLAFFVVEVRQGTLWSGARGWGPMGITLIQRLLFGSGVEHCDLQLSVEVRRESLWSRGCCSGPAGSGREHSDPELAVRVRRGTLRSRACSWGPVRNTLILGLLFRSGGERCDLAFAVEVRRRRRRRRRRDSWHKI